MKYLFFITGFILIMICVGLAVSGARGDWDAYIAFVPGAVGFLLTGASVVIHVYDNWESKQ